MKSVVIIGRGQWKESTQNCAISTFQTTTDFLNKAAARGITILTSESFATDPRQQVRNIQVSAESFAPVLRQKGIFNQVQNVSLEITDKKPGIFYTASELSSKTN